MADAGRIPNRNGQGSQPEREGSWDVIYICIAAVGRHSAVARVRNSNWNIGKTLFGACSSTMVREGQPQHLARSIMLQLVI